MAIQFPCASCGQPIEIDDEWGGKTVACPFCHSRINAPHESQLLRDEPVPTASPASLGPAPPTAMSPGFPQIADATLHVPQSNRLAIAAVILAALLLAELIAMKVVVSGHIGEIEALGERWQALMAEGQGFVLAWQKTQTELMENNGGTFPTWMMLVGIFEILAGLTWIAAVICGIFALRRTLHRQYAIASLVVCGVTPVLFCCCGGM